MPIRIDRTRLTYRMYYHSIKFSIVSYTDANKQNHYVSKLRIPYIVTVHGSTAHYTKPAFVQFCLTGGRGDQVVARFAKDDTDCDLWAMLQGLLTETSDVPNFFPLLDRLRELDHWITPLLAKWLEHAAAHHHPRELKPLPVKRKLWED